MGRNISKQYNTSQVITWNCKTGLMLLRNEHRDVIATLLLFGNVVVSLNINPYAVGGLFGPYNMMQKAQKSLKPWHMGTHLRVLSEIYPMNTNMREVYMVFKNLCIFELLIKVASAVEGLRI